MIPRVRNARPDWNYTAYEPIAGNYYPVTAAMTTQDASRGLALTVVTDRSHGGSSLEDGSLCEGVMRGTNPVQAPPPPTPTPTTPAPAAALLLLRRIQSDDGWGVGEALNETGLDARGAGIVARGTHRLSLGPVAGAGAARRALMQAGGCGMGQRSYIGLQSFVSIACLAGDAVPAHHPLLPPRFVDPCAVGCVAHDGFIR